MYSTVHQNDDIGNKIFIGSRGMSYKDDTQLHRVGVRHVQSCSGRECQQLNLCSSTVIADWIVLTHTVHGFPGYRQAEETVVRRTLL